MQSYLFPYQKLVALTIFKTLIFLLFLSTFGRVQGQEYDDLYFNDSDRALATKKFKEKKKKWEEEYGTREVSRPLEQKQDNSTFQSYDRSPFDDDYYYYSSNFRRFNGPNMAFNSSMYSSNYWYNPNSFWQSNAHCYDPFYSRPMQPGFSLSFSTANTTGFYDPFFPANGFNDPFFPSGGFYDPFFGVNDPFFYNYYNNPYNAYNAGFFNGYSMGQNNVSGTYDVNSSQRSTQPRRRIGTSSNVSPNYNPQNNYDNSGELRSFEQKENQSSKSTYGRDYTKEDYNNYRSNKNDNYVYPSNNSQNQFKNNRSTNPRRNSNQGSNKPQQMKKKF